MEHSNTEELKKMLGSAFKTVKDHLDNGKPVEQTAETNLVIANLLLGVVAELEHMNINIQAQTAATNGIKTAIKDGNLEIKMHRVVMTGTNDLLEVSAELLDTIAQGVAGEAYADKVEKKMNPESEEEKPILSNCCGAYLPDWPDSDICPNCKEHCSVQEEE